MNINTHTYTLHIVSLLSKREKKVNNKCTKEVIELFCLKTILKFARIKYSASVKEFDSIGFELRSLISNGQL